MWNRLIESRKSRVHFPYHEEIIYRNNAIVAAPVLLRAMAWHAADGFILKWSVSRLVQRAVGMAHY